MSRIDTIVKDILNNCDMSNAQRVMISEEGGLFPCLVTPKGGMVSNEKASMEIWDNMCDLLSCVKLICGSHIQKVNLYLTTSTCEDKISYVTSEDTITIVVV